MAARIAVMTAGAGGLDHAELDRRIAADLAPAIIRSEQLGGPSLNADALDGLGGLRGRVLRRLPGGFGVALAALGRRREYDVVYTWGEGTAIPFALVLALLPRRRVRHVAFLMRPFDRSSPSRARRLFKQRVLPVIARRGMDLLCVPAPVQRRQAIGSWGIPAGRLVPLEWSLDTAFWQPTEAEQDTICSVGREMRDYVTLLAALDGTGVPCHVASGTNALNPAHGTEDERARNVAGALPDGVTVGPLEPAALRALYARSRFVVVPLVETDSDNGITATLEAMSMGRAVIASATEGRSELLHDGENCVLVPPGDAAALREAILALWSDPEACERLGRAGRETVLAYCTLERWERTLRDAVDAL